MRIFKRLHDRCEPPGLEQTILKQVPLAFLLSTLIPIALAVAVRVLPAEAGVDIARRITTVDIYALATALVLWSGILAVAIGCIVVYVMKGPAYVADAYPIDDAPRPVND